MLTVEEIEAIRRAYYHEHQSVRAIARGRGHGRRVVREVIRGEPAGPRRYRLRVRKRRPVLDPVSAIIDAWLVADQTAPRKQRHTAKRIAERLVAEYAFAGSERQVRKYVQDWKAAHRSDAVGYVPLAYAPGLEVQCDWGEALVAVAGVEQTAQVFCMRLCASLACFVCAFPTARQECFFAGHVAAFALWNLSHQTNASASRARRSSRACPRTPSAPRPGGAGCAPAGSAMTSSPPGGGCTST